MLNVINPATEKVIKSVPTDNPSAVAAKHTKARSAQRAWRALPFAERAAVVKKFADALAGMTEEAAQTLTAEMGKPISQARNEVKGTQGRLEFFLAETEARLASRQVHADTGLKEIIGLEPLGVIANVSAWNYPWFVGINVHAPALLTGSAVLYKPSEFSPLTGLLMADLWQRAGLPDGLFQTVIGGADIGRALIEQPVDGVFFTGSYATGKAIAAAVAPRMIRLQLELGGKDPVYVRGDVDAAAAAEAVADGAFYNAGQSCCAVERIYVDAKIHDAFVERFVTFTKSFVVGDPTDDKTYIGPLARKAQLDVLKQQVDDAVAKGAKLHTGGKPMARSGYYFEPTVLSNVDHKMTIMRDESFGPVIGIQKVKDDGEALRHMNDTTYGLTAGVYTRDEAAARRILSDVNAGSVYWNCCDRVSPRLPWSGRGHSGVGVTLSVLGIDTFLKPKAWHLRSPAN
jgi:acyl-CoA reductase-like NAD-dependent aldehyde dehydrogenase